MKVFSAAYHHFARRQGQSKFYKIENLHFLSSYCAKKSSCLNLAVYMISQKNCPLLSPFLHLCMASFIDRVPYFSQLTRNIFSHLMQIWQLFIILCYCVEQPSKVIKKQCMNCIKQVFFISTSGIPPVNGIDLQALSLVGPTVTRPVLDPLAVMHLNNQLFMSASLHYFET